MLLLLLATSCFLFGPTTAQFPGGPFPPFPPPDGGGETPQCTPATAPPPALRPLDNGAGSGMSLDLLPNCSLIGDPDQKSAISEISAQQLALCNSFCINRVFSGAFALNDAQKQAFPGYPVWLLATLSYVLSEDGVNGRDCIDGDGCNTNCGRFVPTFNPLNPFAPLIGGFVSALECKLGCMLQFESSSSTCAEDCRMNCNSVACQCSNPFGDGCFIFQAPPCGRDCSATSCGYGCIDANSYTNNTPTYPFSANPTQAPIVTQIGNGTHYMINVTNSIPSGVSGDLGYSTLIVRVHDLSSITQDDFTYYVLENGFEFDLAPFECRRVNVSFAVATHQMAVSSYSPSVMLELSTAGALPSQLTDFNFTVEQDNRAGFYQHHIIHLEWETPQNIEFATGYTITLSPVSSPDICLSATFDITNGSLTSYIIQSSNSFQPPISNCVYIIQIAVNPRDRGREVAQKTIGPFRYNDPSTDNIAYSCSSTLDRSSNSYDLTLSLHLDETFTPAVISAINFLRASSFQVNSNRDVIIAEVVTRSIHLNVTQGPLTLNILFDDRPQLLNGFGYRLIVNLEWNISLPRTPPAISAACEIYDVTPIPSDPVENIAITFQQVIPQSESDSSGSVDQQGGSNIDRLVITLRYTWRAPDFQGEGITGYQALLSKEPAPESGIISMGNLRQIGRNATHDELVATFDESDTNFTLYFQIRPISTNTHGNWSEPIILNVQDIPPTALNVDITCSSVLNMTTRSYDITVVFFIDATFTASRVSAIDSIRTTIVEVDGSGNAVLPNFRRESFTFQGIEKGPGSVTLVLPNKRPVAERQSFYSVQSFLVWKSSFPSLPSTVGGSCQIRNVGPLPPDPITNLQLLSTRKRFFMDRKSVRVTANFSWTAPEFIGTEGSIVGYQVWFNRVPASGNVTRFVTHGAQARSAEVEMTFDIGDTDFSLLLQIRALGATTVGNWSRSDSIFLQVRVPCPVGFFRDPSVTSFQCIPCPANTNLTLLNEATVCPCLPGYFRAAGDNPGVQCSRPPTACRNIRINLLGDRRIDVIWNTPFLTGRDDFYYVLEWSASLSPSLLTSLGFSAREINGSVVIFDHSDTVSHSITGLRPETPYSVTVTARNGVSDQGDSGNENSSRCQLQGVTLKAANASLSLPSPTSLTTLLGCGIDILCGGTGSVVVWRRFGTRIELTNTTNRIITTETNSTSNTVHSQLMIDPIMNDDAGAYTCSIIDLIGVSTHSSFSLIVNNTFVYIEPVEDIELSNDQLGQVITVNCRVSTCRDSAEVVFARGFEILNRAELFSDATNVVLSTDLVVSDNITGNYLCQVSQSDMIHQTAFRISRRLPPVICPRGTYKNSTSAPFECLPCPSNTNGSMINASVCPCLPGYFRTSSEGPEIDCTSPPSVCRNIKSTFIGAQSLNVEWERPEVTGREDYYYILQYTDGESIGSNQVINQSQVVSQLITGLKPVTKYTITVTVVNGVSNQDVENEFKRRCELMVTTIEGVSSDPVDVQSYGDVVVWNEPLNPNGQITEYEIQFLVPGTQLRITRSRNIQGTFYAVQDDDKLGGIPNTYVRVRARTSAGAGQWSIEIPLSSGTEGTPAPPTTCPVCTCPICPTTAPPCTCGTETPTSPPQLQGVHFILRGRPLANNSVIALANIGELGDALLCRTNLTSCCGTVQNRFGQFYYPSGVAVPINRQQQGFYRNRGNQEIRLHRRSGVSSPTGKFRCEIPDSNMILQNLFIELI